MAPPLDPIIKRRAEIFRRIAKDESVDGDWDELSDYIVSLAKSEPLKALQFFVDLPPVSKKFKFVHVILEEACKVLLSPKQVRVEDWSLALQAFVKLWIQLVHTGTESNAIRSLMMNGLRSVVYSVKKLVENGNEQFLIRGLEDFERFFSRDMNKYHYTAHQRCFVFTFMMEIERIAGTQTKEIVRKIKLLATEQVNLNTREEDFYRRWYDHLKKLSPVEVLKIFKSTELEERSREIAIRRLNVLLSDHSLGKLRIDTAEMKKLESMLIHCLKEVEMSDSMFKVLGEVVNHVTFEMLVYQDEECTELRDYIASSTTEFHRAIYIFQCLTMTFANENFIIPVMENLFPQIITRLDPPSELLVDNSYWSLAFTGGFCAAIHMVEDIGYAKSVKMIAEKMISSVRELVERKMEIGLVRRALRDVERIVKKQVEWYSVKEYKLLKVLLWRFYAIKGMTWESKIVLWRINVIIERGIKEEEKDLPKNDFDWLHSTDEVHE